MFLICSFSLNIVTLKCFPGCALCHRGWPLWRAAPVPPHCPAHPSGSLHLVPGGQGPRSGDTFKRSCCYVMCPIAFCKSYCLPLPLAVWEGSGCFAILTACYCIKVTLLICSAKTVPCSCSSCFFDYETGWIFFIYLFTSYLFFFLLQRYKI